MNTRAAYATLSICTLKGAKVYLNGEQIEQLQNIRLEPMIAQVRVQHPKAEPVQKQIALKRGDREVVEINPEIPTGDIQVAVVPLDCRIELIGDTGEHFQGERSQLFTDIPVGKYSIKVARDKYQSQELVLNLEKGAKEILNIELEPGNETGTMVDQDGNTYKTVKIGDQWWMAENLRVTHFRNGDAIPKIISNAEWADLSNGAFCAYDNDEKNAETYGYLYNWYAVNDSRNIAPEGWRVPDDADWKKLKVNRKYTGSSMAHDASLWVDGDLKNNQNFGTCGFFALPGGCRRYDGYYNYIGEYASFWSSRNYNKDYACHYLLRYDDTDMYRYAANKRDGFSIRCIRE